MSLVVLDLLLRVLELRVGVGPLGGVHVAV